VVEGVESTIINFGPGADSAGNTVPVHMVFWQQVSMMDDRGLGSVPPLRSGDRGAVHVQVADTANNRVGDWVKLTPFQNGYDQQAVDNTSTARSIPSTTAIPRTTTSTRRTRTAGSDRLRLASLRSPIAVWAIRTARSTRRSSATRTRRRERVIHRISGSAPGSRPKSTWGPSAVVAVGCGSSSPVSRRISRTGKRSSRAIRIRSTTAGLSTTCV
jgi:hypothetical protein